MTETVIKLHELFNRRHRFSVPFDKQNIPQNGIYILFEKGETFQGFDRIVRVGTHTGDNQLRSRLTQHFITEKKNRSIFRKNIGRCFLAKENDPYLKLWEIDTTSRSKKEEYQNQLNTEFEKELENKITTYMQSNFSFCVFEVKTKEDRLFWEMKIASTLNQAKCSIPSENWLGKFSPKVQIRESGLWQVNELNKEVLTKSEFTQLAELISNL